MTPARRLGILGGTFDPIHCGHLDLGAAAETALGLTQMCVITANVPPHRPQPFASSFHRFAMTAMAVAGRPRWRASDLELATAAPSYTSSTLRQLHQRGYAAGELFFLIGADAFAEIGAWHEYPQILSMAHFAVVSRPGSPVGELPRRLPWLASRMASPPLDANGPADPLIILIDAPTSDVSSTAIRSRRATGQRITGMVPPAVEQHIEQHGLYTSAASGRHLADTLAAPSAERLQDPE